MYNSTKLKVWRSDSVRVQVTSIYLTRVGLHPLSLGSLHVHIIISFIYSRMNKQHVKVVDEKNRCICTFLCLLIPTHEAIGTRLIE